MKAAPQLPVFVWSVAGGCAFLATFLLRGAAAWAPLAVAVSVMLVFGLVRGGRIAAGIWAAALLIASAVVSVISVNSVIYYWVFVLVLAGACAGAAEPSNGRNRIVSGLAWAIALPIGLYAGIAAAIFLDQPLDLLFDRGFVAGRFIGGALGAAVAFLIGENVAALPVKTAVTSGH
jgi:hypothetical protein